MNVLCINCGSSSLKFGVRHVEPGHDEVPVVAQGEIERIGREGAFAWLEHDGAHHRTGSAATDHAGATGEALSLLEQAGLMQDVQAVGFRVVHGGARLLGPARIDEETLGAIREATELAPLHNGPALAAIEETARRLEGRVPLVATFDTAFFAGLPDVAREYALPADVRERLGLRRFGFHGLAHRYMAETYARSHPEVRVPRLITLQLGSGCSAAAILKGRPLDTSMGFTPLEGLIMGTRSGDLDPAIPLLIAEHLDLKPTEVEDLLNKRSGLLGLSGRSNDMRDLLQGASAGDRAASLAVRAFCYRVQKYIGSYMAVLGGATAIVFGGGIGERGPEVRSLICRGMQWAGVSLDEAKNRDLSSSGGVITDGDSRAEVIVIPVDEADVIARDAMSVLA